MLTSIDANSQHAPSPSLFSPGSPNATPKQLDKSEIWQGASSKFLSGASDCRIDATQNRVTRHPVLPSSQTKDSLFSCKQRESISFCERITQFFHSLIKRLCSCLCFRKKETPSPSQESQRIATKPAQDLQPKPVSAENKADTASLYYSGVLAGDDDLISAKKHLNAIADVEQRFFVFKELADRTLTRSYALLKEPFDVTNVEARMQKVKKSAELCILLSKETIPHNANYMGFPVYSYIFNKIYQDIFEWEAAYFEAIKGMPSNLQNQLKTKFALIITLKTECQTWRAPNFSKIFPK